MLLEDDENLNRGIALKLQKEGYQVFSAFQISEAEKLFDENRIDLVISDITLPDGNGLEFCRKIRNKSKVFVLFLTAMDSEIDMVNGYDAGADDYITKPFGLGELRARVAAHLRRENRERKHVITLGELSFSLNSRQVFFQGAEIPFTKSEYAICEYLALNRGQVFSKERIYEHVFGYDGEGDSSAITEHIKNIRAKLQKYGVSPVETVWGIGYKWK